MARTEVRCQPCAATWPGPMARFCGRCGARLTVAEPGGGSQPSRDRPPRPRHRIALLVGALGVATVTLSVTGLPLQDIQPPSAPQSAVELPSRDAVREPAGNPGDPHWGTGEVPSGDEPACQPIGCAAWTASLGGGTFQTAVDRVLRTSPDGVTAVSLTSGDVLWEHDLRIAGVGSRTASPQVHVLGDIFVLAYPQEQRLELRDIGTGVAQWEQEVDVDQVTHLLRAGELLIVAGRPYGPSQQSPNALVAGLRVADGEVLWDRAVHRVVALTADPLLVLADPGELVALDANSGSPLWRRPINGPLHALAGGGQVGALVTTQGVNLIDTGTGEMTRTIARDVTDAGVTRLFGPSSRASRTGWLLAVNTPYGTDPGGQPRTDTTFVDLRDDGAIAKDYEGVTGIAEVDGGIALISQKTSVLALHALDLQGERRWQRLIDLRLDLRGGTCCWTLEPAADRSSFYVVPPRLEHEAVREVDAGTGVTVASFRLPRQVAEAETVRWLGGLAVVELSDRTVIAGPAGSVSVPAGAQLLEGGSRPVVAVEGGLLALDVELLYGSS